MFHQVRKFHLPSNFNKIATRLYGSGCATTAHLISDDEADSVPSSGREKAVRGKPKGMQLTDRKQLTANGL